ncbi:PREDICTED: denticleless protein homolog [Nanorana parkeri]|uniref:denticleless protein homolog n=1 Tax=Nanorana parkeri TaxID=125878 RepID=UPI000853F898|nr:PREDICTED: denticleless protein homolog [Nanorana parkeri]
MSLFQAVQLRARWTDRASQKYPLQSLLQCFQCDRQDEHISYGGLGVAVPPFGCSFSAAANIPHVLAVANEEGIVKLYDTECRDTERQILKDWQAHTNAVFDLAWVPGEHKLVTASGDQTAKLFDVKAGELIGECRGHQGSLKSVSFSKFEKAVFCTGSRDGNVMVWDTRCNKKDGFYRHVKHITGAHNAPDKQTPLKMMKKKKPVARGLAPSVDSQQSVTVVIFQDEHTIISAGAVDGIIKMWDLRKNYTAYRQDPISAKSFPYPGSSTRKLGYSSLVLDSTGSNLFASCTDDNVYMFNVTGLKNDPVSVFSGHLNSTFYIKSSLSPDGQFLLCGSSDHSAYIWQVVTCSDDNTVRLWRLKRSCSKSNEDERGNCVGWARQKINCTPIGKCSRICTPAKSSPVQSPCFTSSPTPAACAPSNTGDLPMSSTTPTSPFTIIPKLHTPTRQKAEASTSSPKQLSTSKVSIKNWVTRTPRSDMDSMKTPSPRKAFTPVEQYPTASSSKVSPLYEKKAKRRLDTSSDQAEHKCFSDCNCVTELEPRLKKAKLDLCSLEEDNVNADSRCLGLADLSKKHEERSDSQLSMEAPGAQSLVGTSCHSRAVQLNKENTTPEKNWLSALGHKLKSDKSVNQNLTSRQSPKSGSAKKAPARTIISSPTSVPVTPGSIKKISTYFHKKSLE